MVDSHKAIGASLGLSTFPDVLDLFKRSPFGFRNPEQHVEQIDQGGGAEAPERAGGTKVLLQSVEPASDSIGSGSSGVGRNEWFMAWAMVDPEHAAELAERELDAIKDAKMKQSTWYGAMECVNLWLAGPDERLKNVLRRVGGQFSPEEED